MSKSKKSKRGARIVTRGKKPVAFRWWSDWTVLWIFGSFGLVYLILIPLDYHPYHWLFSVIGGITGYPLGLFFDTGLPLRAMRFARRRLMRTTFKQVGENKQKGEDK